MDEKLESLRRGYADLTAKAKEDQSRVKAADSAVTQLLTSLKADIAVVKGQQAEALTLQAGAQFSAQHEVLT